MGTITLQESNNNTTSQKRTRRTRAEMEALRKEGKAPPVRNSKSAFESLGTQAKEFNPTIVMNDKVETPKDIQMLSGVNAAGLPVTKEQELKEKRMKAVEGMSSIVVLTEDVFFKYYTDMGLTKEEKEALKTTWNVVLDYYMPTDEGGGQAMIIASLIGVHAAVVIPRYDKIKDKIGKKPAKKKEKPEEVQTQDKVNEVIETVPAPQPVNQGFNLNEIVEGVAV